MTNREWLNGLSDDEFANWLCDAMYDEDLSRTLGTDVYIGISQIKFAYADSRLGLKQWLGERRDTDDMPFADVVEVGLLVNDFTERYKAWEEAAKIDNNLEYKGMARAYKNACDIIKLISTNGAK